MDEFIVDEVELIGGWEMLETVYSDPDVSKG